MGCCHSTTASPYEAPHDANAHDASLPRDSSRAAINTSTRQIQSVPPTRASARSGLPSSSSRPNQPIRAPSPLSRSPKNVSNVLPPWTRSHLEKERQIFFETRVTGHVEIWVTLQEVCTLLRQNNLPDAQAILDAANINCPNGRFARGRGRNRDGRGKGGGVYDEQGVLYDIPEWVVTDPADIIEDSHEKEIDAGSDGAEDDEPLYEDDGPASPGKEDKGKGRADDVDLGEKVRVRARLSTSHGDVVVEYHSRQPARVVVERIREEAGGANVRLFHRGKAIDETKPLGESGWTVKDVVNAFVLND